MFPFSGGRTIPSGAFVVIILFVITFRHRLDCKLGVSTALQPATLRAQLCPTTVLLGGTLNPSLDGKETELWEIIYFKLYKSQLPVVEKALETAALMLGTDKSCGYCLEMICADFLAGAIFPETQR